MSIGLVTVMKNPVTLRLGGNALGEGRSFISISRGINLIGVPLKDSRLRRTSDLLTLFSGVVSVIIMDNDTFKAVSRPGDNGDIPITGEQGIILITTRSESVPVFGNVWSNTSIAAPSIFSKIAKGIPYSGQSPDKVIAFLENVLNARKVETPPKQSALLQNFPNPFNPETWIPYNLNQSSEVKITIFDAKGNLVKILNLGQKPAGSYKAREQAAYWDGRNESNENVASGVYFYTLKASNFTATRKMIILK